MEVSILPIYDVERELLSVQSLQTMWQLLRSDMPNAIDIGDIELQSQLRDSISLVRLKSRDDLGPLIFKSNTENLRYLYHELKNLVMLPSHSNIIGRPLYVVTKKCRWGGKIGVCGFILKYHNQGTLESLLCSHTLDRPLAMTSLCKWGCQVISALIHLRERGGMFYPDLRPDNVLISSLEEGNRAILIDLEQRGNWSSWTAPEVRYLEYLEVLGSSVNVYDESLKSRCRRLLHMHCGSLTIDPDKPRKHYDNTSPGYSRAWISLNSLQQESAMVYSLGKFLWCLFECVGDPSASTALWNSSPREVQSKIPGLEFPRFRHINSNPLRQLIRACTEGAPEWEGRVYPLVRVGHRLYSRPRVSAGIGDPGPQDDIDLASEASVTLKNWWQGEIARMECFFDTVYRPQESKAQVEQAAVFPRPRLREVLTELEKITPSLLSSAT
ncbi:MAG: hypothetical protein M4579_000540 [Chaenotheca gracillima]|nr:MAG: hypothetical protein M4579_000540 [Chaenotheca gracillima]